MKKFYIVGLVLILAMAVGMIAYGTYLNESGEMQITKRMESRTIPLQGEKVKYRNLRPIFVLDTINLSSDEMADAVALIDGRIETAFIKKNSNVRRGQVLFELVNEDIPIKIQQAESSIAKAEAQLLQAKNSFQRYERLKDRNATSMEKYDEARMMYEAAQAARGASRQRAITRSRFAAGSNFTARRRDFNFIQANGRIRDGGDANRSCRELRQIEFLVAR